MLEEKIYEVYNSFNKNIIIKVLLIIVCIVIFILAIGFYKEKNDMLENVNSIDNYLEVGDNSISEIEEEKIVVYIVGEILNPGIYELAQDCRLSDVIDMAGGVTENAFLDKVNLAYKVEDGQKIIIPSIKDENIENIIIEDAGDSIIDEKGAASKKININSANVSELVKISGIGESTAQKIIDYRKNNGKFNSIEDIKKVSGIGENKYNQIKDYIKTK